MLESHLVVSKEDKPWSMVYLVIFDFLLPGSGGRRLDYIFLSTILVAMRRNFLPLCLKPIGISRIDETPELPTLYHFV